MQPGRASHPPSLRARPSPASCVFLNPCRQRPTHGSTFEHPPAAVASSSYTAPKPVSSPMAGLMLGCAASPIGLALLPARKGGLGLQQHGGLEQPQQHLHSTAASFAVAAACSDGLTVTSVVAELGSLSCSSVVPPRVASHTRRLVVPAAGPYQLSATRTRQRRGRSGPGGGGGGDDDDNIWGGGGGSGGGNDFWGGDGSGDEGEDSGSMAARLQDLLLLWSVFCGLAFCQAVAYVSPKPKAVAPAFAALSFSGIKASLLQRRSPALVASPRPLAAC